MRYLIDTNIVVFMIGDPDMLDENVKALLSEHDAILYTSAESAKELVLALRNKRLFAKRWKSANDMLRSIEDEYNIHIRPLNREHLPLISCDTRFGYYRPQGLDFIYNQR